MENVIKYVTGFFGGLLSIMMAVLPVAILWNVFTFAALAFHARARPSLRVPLTARPIVALLVARWDRC